ncbi:MAG: hypothetical protein K9G44_07035 [Melioribacteraceae bacterium]|nr:hypothetical protein [Melioribacteraceae bacterium]
MKNRLFLLFLFSSVVLTAQVPSHFHLIAIGSDGNGIIEAEDSESISEKIKERFVESVQVRLKSVKSFKQNLEQTDDIKRFFSGTYTLSDSADFFVMTLFGAWNEGKFVSNNGNEISAEYIYNFISYLPAKASLTIIASPKEFAFPEEIFAQSISADYNGRLILFLTSNEEVDYDDVLSEFENVIENFADEPELVEDEKGNIRFSVWLAKVLEYLNTEQVTYKVVQINSGPDYIINSTNK